jgi:hypothetical protein
MICLTTRPTAYCLPAQGFLAFAAHGLQGFAGVCFAAQGFLAAHGLAALAAQRLYGLAACATVVAGVTGPDELTSELVHEAAVKARPQTAVVNMVVGRLGCITAHMVFLTSSPGSFDGPSEHSVSFCREERHTARFIPPHPTRNVFSSPGPACSGQASKRVEPTAAIPDLPR